jgi:putative addiction module component (TIGR02574 family)
MSATAENIPADALRLPGSDRADLADKLLESLDPDDQVEFIHPEWEAEIARRVAELDSGRIKATPWPQVRRMLRANEKCDSCFS